MALAGIVTEGCSVRVLTKIVSLAVRLGESRVPFWANRVF